VRGISGALCGVNYSSGSVQTLTLMGMSGGNPVVSQDAHAQCVLTRCILGNWDEADGTGIDSFVLTTAVMSGSVALPALPWIMDNFQYAVVAVPEPASALYLAAGLALPAMGLSRRGLVFRHLSTSPGWLP